MRNGHRPDGDSLPPERLRRKKRIHKMVAPPGLPKPQVDPEAFLQLRKASETAAAENASLRDALARQKAEFDNFRRRSQKEKGDVRRQASEDVVAQLLPVIDNFDRALDSAHSAADAESIREGIRMVREQMLRILEGCGLERMTCAGAEFTPALHEALAVEERSDVPSGQIIEELLPGYKFLHRVLRPAMVKVSKAPSEAEAQPEQK
jgi:molecular chaperone GrpE